MIRIRTGEGSLGVATVKNMYLHIETSLAPLQREIVDDLTGEPRIEEYDAPRIAWRGHGDWARGDIDPDTVQDFYMVAGTAIFAGRARITGYDVTAAQRRYVTGFEKLVPVQFEGVGWLYSGSLPSARMQDTQPL